MDDIVLFADSPEELNTKREAIEAFLSNTLQLHFKTGSVWLNKASHGLSFLGMRIFPRLVRVRAENRRRSLRRILHKLHAWRSGRISEERMHQGLISSVQHLKKFSPALRVTGFG